MISDQRKGREEMEDFLKKGRGGKEGKSGMGFGPLMSPAGGNT